eukprot:2714940-Lingulodinium_polyedra.AAC.1
MEEAVRASDAAAEEQKAATELLTELTNRAAKADEEAIAGTEFASAWRPMADALERVCVARRYGCRATRAASSSTC